MLGVEYSGGIVSLYNTGVISSLGVKKYVLED